jgi:hypothetical protein
MRGWLPLWQPGCYTISQCPELKIDGRRQIIRNEKQSVGHSGSNQFVDPDRQHGQLALLREGLVVDREITAP